MTLYRSAFAVPSGFAVATRTATKGKTTAAQEPVSKLAGIIKIAKGRTRQAAAIVTPVRAA